MILFLLSLIYTAWSLLCLDRIRRTTLLFTVSFAVLLCFEWINGVVHITSMKLIGEDISPLLALFMLPFFELTIYSKRQITQVIRIIMLAAIVMLTGYAALAIALLGRIVTFTSLYAWLNGFWSEDFIFEGGNGRIFYKGALYIGIAIIFFAFRRTGWSRVVAFLLFLSLFLVGARGFFVALALTAILYVLIGPIRPIKKLGYACALFIVAAIALPLLFSQSGDKTTSDTVRINTIHQVSESVSIISFISGHGFGIGVPERPVHMEITYLEIFQKQGCLGLLWWTALIVTLAMRFKRAIKIGNHSLAYPLLLSAVFILLESATNPFLNNPIGMYPFIISFVGLGVLAHPNSSMPRENSGMVASEI